MTDRSTTADDSTRADPVTDTCGRRVLATRRFLRLGLRFHVLGHSSVAIDGCTDPALDSELNDRMLLSHVCAVGVPVSTMDSNHINGHINDNNGTGQSASGAVVSELGTIGVNRRLGPVDTRLPLPTMWCSYNPKTNVVDGGYISRIPELAKDKKSGGRDRRVNVKMSDVRKRGLADWKYMTLTNDRRSGIVAVDFDGDGDSGLNGFLNKCMDSEMVAPGIITANLSTGRAQAYWFVSCWPGDETLVSAVNSALDTLLHGDSCFRRLRFQNPACSTIGTDADPREVRYGSIVFWSLRDLMSALKHAGVTVRVGKHDSSLFVDSMYRRMASENGVPVSDGRKSDPLDVYCGADGEGLSGVDCLRFWRDFKHTVDNGGTPDAWPVGVRHDNTVRLAIGAVLSGVDIRRDCFRKVYLSKVVYGDNRGSERFTAKERDAAVASVARRAAGKLRKLRERSTGDSNGNEVVRLTQDESNAFMSGFRERMKRFGSRGGSANTDVQKEARDKVFSSARRSRSNDCADRDMELFLMRYEHPKASRAELADLYAKRHGGSVPSIRTVSNAFSRSRVVTGFDDSTGAVEYGRLIGRIVTGMLNGFDDSRYSDVYLVSVRDFVSDNAMRYASEYAVRLLNRLDSVASKGIPVTRKYMEDMFSGTASEALNALYTDMDSRFGLNRFHASVSKHDESMLPSFLRRIDRFDVKTVPVSTGVASSALLGERDLSVVDPVESFLHGHGVSFRRTEMRMLYDALRAYESDAKGSSRIREDDESILKSRMDRALARRGLTVDVPPEVVRWSVDCRRCNIDWSLFADLWRARLMDDPELSLGEALVSLGVRRRAVYHLLGSMPWSVGDLDDLCYELDSMVWDLACGRRSSTIMEMMRD